MWHVGLHYFLPFSQMTAEEHQRDVVSQDVAGITSYFGASLWIKSDKSCYLLDYQ